MTNQDLAIAALKCGQCLALTYEGRLRLVEVHTVGTTTAGKEAMSAWQVAGQTHSSPVQEWKLFALDQCMGMQISGEPSQAPRPGYRRGAKQFSHIVAEL